MPFYKSASLENMCRILVEISGGSVAVWAHFRSRPFPAFPASGPFRPLGP